MLTALTAVLIAAAPPEALLLGVEEQGTLATYLVDETGARLLGRGLAVPGPHGFFLVDVSPEQVTVGRRETSTTRELWAKSEDAGRPPWWSGRTDGGGTRLGPDGGDGTSFDEEEDPGLPLNPCESRSTVSVTFASWRALGVRSDGYTDCGAHPTDSSGSRIFRLATLPAEVPIPFDELFPPGARGALEKVAEDERNSEPCLGQLNFESLLVSRDRGAWVAAVQLMRSAEACRAFEKTLAVPAELPRSLGLPPRVPAKRLGALQRKLGAVGDALVSPSGHTTLVLLKGGGGAMVTDGRADLRFELGVGEVQVVLAEWIVGAKGRDRWRREASALLGPMPVSPPP